MMMLRLSLKDMQVQKTLARDLGVETCSVGLVFAVNKVNTAHSRFVVRELVEVPSTAYADRTSTSASLKPEFCIEIANRARKAGAGVLLAHTHVGASTLDGFSFVDDEGEAPLAAYFGARVPGHANFAAVFTPNVARARQLGGKDLAEVVGVGPDIYVERQSSQAPQERFDRQIRAFGIDGQHALRRLKIMIVGLGGTGSLVAQQLAHLGVQDFILVDPDTVETTNLNRLVGAGPESVGAAKVLVAARNIQRINPAAHCDQIIGDIVDGKVAQVAATADFIFGCTDSMASRAVLNQLAYQYLVPCIDMGVAIGVNEGRVRYITGRTQMLSPGIACLVCTDKLDAEQVRRELLTEELRKLDLYIVGGAVAQPAVISLNSTVASAAITMFLASVTGIPSRARMVIYDGVQGSLRPAAMEPRPHCIVCSLEGALGRGHSWDLPVRAGAVDV